MWSESCYYTDGNTGDPWKFDADLIIKGKHSDNKDKENKDNTDKK